MEIEIKKNNQTYLIYIYPKQMKRMILKYRDGKFVLSIPKTVSMTEIKNWLNTIEQSELEKMQAASKVKQSKDFVYLFGKKYQLIHYPIGLNKVILKEDSIVIYQYRQEEALKHFLYQQLESYIQERLVFFNQKGYVDFVPEFKILKMKARYGACFYQKKLLKFALMLVHEEKEVIDSVIIHELGHFYYPNHSSHFYGWVKAHDAHFETSKKILKRGGIGDDSVNK